MSCEELDVLFLRALVGRLGRAALEVAIARGRLRRGHLTAKGCLLEARTYIVKTRNDLEGLGHTVWGDAFRTSHVVATERFDDALDVHRLRVWSWSLRLAGEDVMLARSTLGQSRRQRVTHAMLLDVRDHLGKASNGLEQLAKRAWA